MISVPKLTKLEEEPMWIEVNSLVEYVYDKLSDMPEDEKWDTTSKLRSAANNLLYCTAESLGDASPSAMEYGWGATRKYVSSLKTMYRFAVRQKFIAIEPEIMVRLDALMKQIDERVKLAYQQTIDNGNNGPDDWQKKYKLRDDKQNEG